MIMTLALCVRIDRQHRFEHETEAYTRGVITMAFGIKREELEAWKRQVIKGEIAFLTHFWFHPRFPQYKTVTKVGCADIAKLKKWVKSHGLDPKYIHYRNRYPHFDLIGPKQIEILIKEELWDHLERFAIKNGSFDPF